MQISKIGSINFKGLWTFKRTDVKQSIGRHCPVYFEDAIYHPFKDETQEEIDKIIAKEKETPVYEYLYDIWDPCGPDDITVLNHIVGERLNITSDEFAKTGKTPNAGHPEQDPSSNCRYRRLNKIPTDLI